MITNNKDCAGVRGKVAMITVPAGEKQREAIRLVPSESGPLQIGVDDLLIQSQNHGNLLDLEREDISSESFYIVTIEMPVVPLSLKGKAKPVYEHVPHNLIRASSMLEAIQLFEEESGRRHWLPDGDKFDKQTGVGRVAGSTARTVRIRKIRKDAILSKE